MVRTRLMANSFSAFSRRRFMARFGAATLTAMMPRASAGQAPQTLRLEARPGAILLRPGEAPTPIWGLEPAAATPRLKAGQLEVTFRNALPVPAVLDWPIQPGAEVSFPLPLRRAGTFFADLRLLAPPEAPPCRPLPLVVEETVPILVDRDETILIEDWGDRTAGSRPEAGDPPPAFTVNGRILPDIATRSGERMRLRFINGSQRLVIAVRLEGLEVRVIAMDSAPAEPFPARNGALVLAPGGRVDALIDVTTPPGTASQILLHDGQQPRPIGRLAAASEAPIRSTPLAPAPALAADGLPAQLDLKNAMRVDVALQGSDWVTLAGFAATQAPAFKVKAGHTVVLALNNRAEPATSFHLHGHHFRLLDRLDDGWKPFWLDTLVVEPGQAQRIAFAADGPGRWLMESTAARRAVPRLLKWFSID
jgi:FtsP/CotA-like multicopper oxidase with cupredoxin domain